jgi:hypothetical protein
MSENEILAVVVCALVGYWVVSALFISRDSKAKPGQEAEKKDSNTP